MAVSATGVVSAIEQMGENVEAKTEGAGEANQRNHRLLQAGYQFSDPSDDDYMDEVYRSKWEVMEAWFNRKKIPHAIVRISQYDLDQVVVRMLVVAEVKFWNAARVAFPTMAPAPSRLPELLCEPQTDRFGWEVTFRHIDSRNDVVFVDGYWKDDGKEFQNYRCIVDNYLKDVAIEDFFYHFDEEEIIGDHGDFVVTAYRADPWALGESN